jgi:hypothetical protein
MQLNGSLSPGLNLGISFVAPPQFERERVFALAEMQVSAFFYWITFNPETNRGASLPGGFVGVTFSPRTDWGSAIPRAFMSAIREWDANLIASTAEGYFKVEIRRNPTAAPCWSWALEWNENLRIIGFFGAEQPANALIRNFPKPQVSRIDLEEGFLQLRKEVPLTPAEDTLFAEPA